MATVQANPMPVMAPPAEAKTKKRREKKSWSTVLTSADGRAVKVTASRKSDGSAKTHVLLSTPIGPGGKKRKNEIGAREVHASIEAAMKTKDKLVTEMQKRGWVVKEAAPRGFQAKPDAFDVNSLPVAAKSSKKK